MSHVDETFKNELAGSKNPLAVEKCSNLLFVLRQLRNSSHIVICLLGPTANNELTSDNAESYLKAWILLEYDLL